MDNRKTPAEYKEKHQLSLMLILSGSGGGIRTHDQLVNSQLRYRCATPECFVISE